MSQPYFSRALPSEQESYRTWSLWSGYYLISLPLPNSSLRSLLSEILSDNATGNTVGDP